MFNRLLCGSPRLPVPITNMGGNPYVLTDGITDVSLFDSSKRVMKNGIPPNTWDPYVGIDFGSSSPVILSSWKTYHSNDLGATGLGSPTVWAKLQGSNDLSTWTDVGGTASATDTAGLTLSQNSGLGSTPYRAWRVIFRHNRSPDDNVVCVELELTVA